jgi:hypothetical protein
MPDDPLHARRSELVEEALSALKDADAELESLVGIERQLIADADRLMKLASQLSHTIPESTAKLEDAAVWQQIQSMKQSFNLMYIELHQAIDYQSRQFMLVSNVMKTKHDTAKNSIGNIR